MIKDKKTFKLSKHSKFLGVIFAAVMALGGCGHKEPAPEIVTPVEPVEPDIVDVIRIPTLSESLDKLEEIYGGADKIYILFKGIVRRAYYADKPTKVNICFEPNFTQKIILEDVIKEYNEIFKVINPNYQFVLNYSPTQEDIENDKYAVDIYLSDELSQNVGGQTEIHFEDCDKGFSAFEIVNCKINIDANNATDGRKFANIFRHEFMHTFGCGDAYLNDEATNDTIMQTVSNSMVGLYKIDVAFLDALYRSPSNALTDEEIQSFIDNYDNNDEQYGLTNTVLKINKILLNDIDMGILKSEISNSKYLPAVKNAVLAGLGNALKFERMDNIYAFAEEQRTEHDNYLYLKTPYISDPIYDDVFKPGLYRVDGDPQGGAVSCMTDLYHDNYLINNVDYDRSYLFLKVDDYILSLKTGYSFTDLDQENNMQFAGIYRPTNQNAFEYNLHVSGWKDNEKTE